MQIGKGFDFHNQDNTNGTQEIMFSNIFKTHDVIGHPEIPKITKKCWGYVEVYLNLLINVKNVFKVDQNRSMN